jgi:choline dehydrogenase-like flavoprotein
MVRSFAPIQPRHDNYIEPLPGDGPGKFRVHLSLSADDVATRDRMVTAIAQVRIALGADAAQIQIMPPGASHHEAGGLIMGADGASSVCDGFGRIRTVQRLVVADAAAWPGVPPANPHLTIVAIARRTATQINADLN